VRVEQGGDGEFAADVGFKEKILGDNLTKHLPGSGGRGPCGGGAAALLLSSSSPFI
jgi:hypothetical protein